jgi:Reverse transcriptase (RNA-dependent DNA polymerase)
LVKPMHYPLTKIDNLFEKCSKYKLFSLIDIKNAFLSVALTERAKKRSAIITPFGVFLPQRTPFGLKTSPSAFCYVMRLVLKDLDFCEVYMDDIIVCALNEQDMTEKLIKLFETLNRFNLKIQLSKVKFFQRELKVLGMIFSEVGLRKDPAKIQAIKNFPPITTVKQLQKFLGMVTYLSSFIPHYSTRAYPLFHLLKKENQKNFQLTKEANLAIQELKEVIQEETMRYNISYDEPIYISVDASQTGMGAFVYQVKIYDL